jgi:hypothetical protein
MKRTILIPILLSTLIFSSNGLAECVNGNCTNGTGSKTYANGGGTYYGTWKNGLPNGYGTYNWLDGKKYEGYWKDGTFNGKGTYTFSDGTSRTGIWENNKYIGTVSEVEEKRKADAIKAEQEREDKKRWEKIYNACYLDKGNDVDMTVGGNRTAVRKICRGIANDPSFLERWKYE